MIRAGEQVLVSAVEVVPGDVVLLQAGDKVPADLRLVRSRDLQIDESALTGESLPVEKSPDAVAHDQELADRTQHGLRVDAGDLRAGDRRRRSAPATTPRSAASPS